MSEQSDDVEKLPAKRSKLPVLLGLVLALMGAGGGFYAAWSGVILAGVSSATAPVSYHDGESHDAAVSFLSVEPMTISVGEPNRTQHLRFRADLEVPEAAADDVRKMMPRVVDVLNSYLHALDPGELEDRATLARLRAQMLRRVQVVVGVGKVSDLLVMEFVLN